MRRIAFVAVPAVYAFRRMRRTPLSAAIMAIALAAAAGLIGWSSVAAALSHEESVRLRLAELPSDERSVQVVYDLAAGEKDTRGPAVDAFFDELAALVERPRQVSLWHSVGEEGVRLVVAGNPTDDVVVATGRLPSGCSANVCEALALAGGYRVGQTMQVRGKTAVRIVGQGSLRPEALPLESDALPRTTDLTSRAVLVPSLDQPLAALADRETGNSVVTTAALNPDAVHASGLRALSARLRREVVRLERSGPSLEVGPSIDVTAPLALLDELADRGDVARERLLLVAGQAAALVVAFAAFAASARRRESVLLDEQLTTLSASRSQIAVARFAETAVPSLAGALVAVAGLRIAVEVIADRRALPSFAAAALSLETVVAIATVTTAAVALLFASLASRHRSRFGIGPLELAAVTALALVAWQASTSGALDPERIEAGERAGPVLLLLPALAFFATGVLLLRLLPLVLRLAERVSRTAPFGVRLAFLTAARTPLEAASATTFLAVALGASLFGLNYRATLDRQARDEALFAAGARWRVVERAPGDSVAGGRRPSLEVGSAGDIRPLTIAEEERVSGEFDVTPLTRFARVSVERPTPVLRFDARVQETTAGGDELEPELVGLPAARLRDVRGWRASFSDLAPAEIAKRLRPWDVRLAGPRIADDATALRFWAAAETTLQRFVVLHFLDPAEQRFAHVRVGDDLLTSEWRRVQLSIPASLRGQEIVGIEFPPVSIPQSAPPDFGSIQFGRFEQRRAGRWSSLPNAEAWAASAAGGSVDVFELAAGPVRRPIQFNLKGTVEPLVHSEIPLPDPLPVLASTRVAELAVGGLLTLSVSGKRIPVRVAAESRFFPTVVRNPSAFVVADYETLFAALNANQPGTALPSEAWFFDPQKPGLLARLREPPFRLAAAVGAEPLTERLLSDPLAAGARDVLGVAALAAAALGVFGLVLAARSAIASEGQLLAEYEALGVPPATLTRSTQLRLLALAFVGVAAGVVGGLLALRLIGAFVAVTGTAKRPLPPIEPVIAWETGGIVLAAVAVAAFMAAALLAARAVRETAARRLRA